MHLWHGGGVQAQSDLSSQATTGQQLLVALLTVARRLKPRGTDGRLDPASVYLLHHVLANAPLRVSELARCTRLDASTVSRHVKHLEDGGYLARTGDPDDRRASRVQLTDKGHALLHHAMLAQAAVVDRAIAAWTDEERNALTTLMTRLADSLDRATEEATEEEETESR
jgi:DNA-binding MarR family transcriptional regulator